MESSQIWNITWQSFSWEGPLVNNPIQLKINHFYVHHVVPFGNFVGKRKSNDQIHRNQFLTYPSCLIATLISCYYLASLSLLKDEQWGPFKSTASENERDIKKEMYISRQIFSILKWLFSTKISLLSLQIVMFITNNSS